MIVTGATGGAESEVVSEDSGPVSEQTDLSPSLSGGLLSPQVSQCLSQQTQ